jgi:hypothetical protein
MVCVSPCTTWYGEPSRAHVCRIIISGLSACILKPQDTKYKMQLSGRTVWMRVCSLCWDNCLMPSLQLHMNHRNSNSRMWYSIIVRDRMKGGVHFYQRACCDNHDSPPYPATNECCGVLATFITTFNAAYTMLIESYSFCHPSEGLCGDEYAREQCWLYFNVLCDHLKLYTIMHSHCVSICVLLCDMMDSS